MLPPPRDYYVSLSLSLSLSVLYSLVALPVALPVAIHYHFSLVLLLLLLCFISHILKNLSNCDSLYLLLGQTKPNHSQNSVPYKIQHPTLLVYLEKVFCFAVTLTFSLFCFFKAILFWVTTSYHALSLTSSSSFYLLLLNANPFTTTTTTTITNTYLKSHSLSIKKIDAKNQ